MLLFAAVCCAAPLTGAIGAITALQTQAVDDTGLAEGSSADIPPRMLAAYQKAAARMQRHVPRCRGLQWPVLAGIAKVESNHATGRSISARGDIRPKIYGVLLNGSGVGGNTTVFPDTEGGRWDGTASGERAVGPFQFIPSTWAHAGKDNNGDQQADPHNAYDAALGAAVYLCGRSRDLNKTGQLRAALFQYNRSGAYVDNVLGWINQYRAAAKAPGLSSVQGKVRTVLKAALAQRGVPYSWGGGNASGPTLGICCSPSGKSGANIRGFDCSGLTVYAYAKVGIRLPRTAAAQATRGLRIPASAGQEALKPGDLVFYAYAPGRDSTIHHVGIYAGHGQMINAARPGTTVRLDPVDAMPGYAGGARLL
ncbi:NlpC/P60 family protein [Streptomyces monticola]|uniref:NlpC/P60 family protein n=1 Tax=Streptomyces monticola TaxID=2666263 RepID=A0ABW2JS16_9ACTN